MKTRIIASHRCSVRASPAAWKFSIKNLFVFHLRSLKLSLSFLSSLCTRPPSAHEHRIRIDPHKLFFCLALHFRSSTSSHKFCGVYVALAEHSLLRVGWRRINRNVSERLKEISLETHLIHAEHLLWRSRAIKVKLRRFVFIPRHATDCKRN